MQTLLVPASPPPHTPHNPPSPPLLASPLIQRQQALFLQLPGLSPPPILGPVTGHPMDLSSILY